MEDITTIHLLKTTVTNDYFDFGDVPLQGLDPTTGRPMVVGKVTDLVTSVTVNNIVNDALTAQIGTAVNDQIATVNITQNPVIQQLQVLYAQMTFGMNSQEYQTALDTLNLTLTNMPTAQKASLGIIGDIGE